MRICAGLAKNNHALKTRVSYRGLLQSIIKTVVTSAFLSSEFMLCLKNISIQYINRILVISTSCIKIKKKRRADDFLKDKSRREKHLSFKELNLKEVLSHVLNVLFKIIDPSSLSL